jgi:hypothetical protein
LSESNKTPDKISNKIHLGHISYSALVDTACPLKFKLNWIDRLERKDNEFSVFGKVVHEIAEDILKNNSEIESSVQNYKTKLRAALLSLPELKFTAKDIKEFKEQGEGLLREVRPAFEKFFEGKKWEVLSVEEQLMEPIPEFTLDTLLFKGFIDILIGCEERIYLIDLKTCSFGWKPEKKSDTMTTYQLTYYKAFWSKKLGIPVKDIDCYFVLLKRTAPKDRVEFVKIPVGERKIKNAMEFLVKMLTSIYSGKFNKNKTACKWCPYKGTEKCP